MYPRTPAKTLWPEAALFHYRTRSGADVDFVDGVEVLPLKEFLDELPA